LCYFLFFLNFGDYLDPGFLKVEGEESLPVDIHSLNVGHSIGVDCYFDSVVPAEGDEGFFLADGVRAEEQPSRLKILDEVGEHADGPWLHREGSYPAGELEDRIAEGVVEVQFLDGKAAAKLVSLVWGEYFGCMMGNLGTEAHVSGMKIVLPADFEEHHDWPCHVVGVEG
jgi:hypothetical protein